MKFDTLKLDTLGLETVIVLNELHSHKEIRKIIDGLCYDELVKFLNDFLVAFTMFYNSEENNTEGLTESLAMYLSTFAISTKTTRSIHYDGETIRCKF